VNPGLAGGISLTAASCKNTGDDCRPAHHGSSQEFVLYNPNIPSKPMEPSPYELIESYVTTMCLLAAHNLDLFRIVCQKPFTAAELSEATGASDESRLLPLLEYLAGIGVLEARDGVYFSNTLTKEFSDRSRPYPWMLELLAGQYIPAFMRLSDSIIEGKTAYVLAFGQHAWEMRQENPAFGDIFHTWQDKETARLAGLFSREWNWSRYPSILDVAGGLGALAQAVAKNCPGTAVSVFETPGVCRRLTMRSPDSDRITSVISGDMFDAVPSGFDAYVLKSVLHDWPDNRCIDLLKNMKAAMGNNAKLIVIERIHRNVSSGSKGHNESDRLQLALSMRMFAVHGGKERTFGDYLTMFTSADLTLLDDKDLQCGFSIFELSR
jgi:hypothetical protein